MVWNGVDIRIMMHCNHWFLFDYPASRFRFPLYQLGSGRSNESDGHVLPFARSVLSDDLFGQSVFRYKRSYEKYELTIRFLYQRKIRIVVTCISSIFSV